MDPDELASLREQARFEATTNDHDSGARVVILSGEFDLASVDRFRTVQPSDRAHLLDLRQLMFVDSTALRELLLFIDAVEQSGGSVTIVCSDVVLRVFELAGVRDSCTIVSADDPSAASILVSDQ